MSSVFFELETLNPNLRSTYFKITNYTDYIANSKFAIRNEDSTHGLFGKIKNISNIELKEDITLVKEYIEELARNKIPIFRGILSLKEIDATRLGYYEKEEWKSLLEDRLPSIADKLNVKYESLEYIGAVHVEEGHPHFQFMIWSEEKRNYFIHYKIKNKLRKEFTNQIFRDDLLPIYQEKDLAKKKITSENYILEQLKKISSDKKFLNEIIQYEKDFNKTKVIKNICKDKDVKEIIESMLDLRNELKKIDGSIKYQYLMKYPNVIEKVNHISNRIISSSIQCQKEIEKYLKAKEKLLEFQYSKESKLLEMREKVKEEVDKEIIKLIGNQILDIERIWLKYNNYTYIKYNNDTINMLDSILTALYYQVESQNRLNKNYELKLNKHLSKQAKREWALNKRNTSLWDWENDLL